MLVGFIVGFSVGLVLAMIAVEAILHWADRKLTGR